MKHKHFLLAWLLLAASCPTGRAQRLGYGAHVGINFSGFNSSSSQLVYDNKTKVGCETGVDLFYHLGSHFVGITGLNVLQTGGKFAVMSPYVSALGNQATEYKNVNTRVLSFEIPLKIGYDFKLGNSFSLIPNAGIFARYTVVSFKDDVVTVNGGRDQWKATSGYDKDSHHIDPVRRFDYGYVAGVDMVYAKHYALSAAYKRGLNTMQSQYGLKTWSANVSLGYRW